MPEELRPVWRIRRRDQKRAGPEQDRKIAILSIVAERDAQILRRVRFARRLGPEGR